jgi:hypothetical protein
MKCGTQQQKISITGNCIPDSLKPILAVAGFIEVGSASSFNGSCQ